MDLPELEYLEQIYRKVRVGETVKFCGKAYRRIYPQNNKFVKHSYHFMCCSEDIYQGTCLIEDDDGEEVNTLCEYKAIFTE